MPPSAADALDLGDRKIDVMDRNLVGNHQPVRVGGREIVQGVVEGTCRLRGTRLQEVEVAVRVDLAVEDLDIDAVDIHIAQPLGRVGVAGPAPRGMLDLGTGRIGLRRIPAEHRPVCLAERDVILLVQFGRQMCLHVRVCCTLTCESEEITRLVTIASLLSGRTCRQSPRSRSARKGAALAGGDNHSSTDHEPVHGAISRGLTFVLA